MNAPAKPRIRVHNDGKLTFRTPYAYYEAAEPSRLRNFYLRRGSQNEQVQKSAVAIRTQARQLVQNYDVARGALRTLVNNVAGPRGIGIEPQPRKADGTIHEEYARDLAEAFRDWCKKPEVTHRLTFSRLQRAIVRAWMGPDGEAFGQMVIGERPDIDHGTRVPFSLEMFDVDLVPFDSDASKKISQGIRRNDWGRPTALHVIKQNMHQLGMPITGETREIPWDRVLHIANIDAINQIRGVSEFASVITRLEDIKDYEESERIAAKIAAMLTAYIRKGSPDDWTGADPSTGSGHREIGLQAGTIIDDLMPGEEVGLIDSKRPNANLLAFRQGQIRAFAAGYAGISYSSTAKDYNGTFSAQRQELVETWVNYGVIVDDFVSMFVAPVWETFVKIAHLSGTVRIPREVKTGTHDDAFFVAQAMPWIDPLKEALGWQALVNAGFASEIEVHRKRGVNPWDVLEQMDTWRKKSSEKGLVFTGNELELKYAVGQE